MGEPKGMNKSATGELNMLLSCRSPPQNPVSSLRKIEARDGARSVAEFFSSSHYALQLSRPLLRCHADVHPVVVVDLWNDVASTSWRRVVGRSTYRRAGILVISAINMAVLQWCPHIRETQSRLSSRAVQWLLSLRLQAVIVSATS
jgi:hypothetical protein